MTRVNKGGGNNQNSSDVRVQPKTEAGPVGNNLKGPVGTGKGGDEAGEPTPLTEFHKGLAGMAPKLVRATDSRVSGSGGVLGNLLVRKPGDGSNNPPKDGPAR